MKYLITESQTNRFVEKITQDTLQELQDVCEDYDESQEPGDWYNWDDCDFANQIVKIVVNDVEKQESTPNLLGNNYPTFRVWINVYYTSIFYNSGMDNIGYVLADRIFEKYKIRVIVSVEEEINVNTDRNW
jgi:hypothetical protein